jgi:hypothetical protein
MLHGTADDTVPIALGRRLFDAAPEPRHFLAFEGGSHSRLHTDAPDRYREALAAFADRVRGAALAPKGTAPRPAGRYDVAGAPGATDNTSTTESLPCPPSSSSPTTASVVKSPSSPGCR